jgi:hypothetical protein
MRSFGQTSPPYHVGSVIENRFGLQVFRVVGKHLARSLRRSSVAADIEKYAVQIEREGVLVIENFLPAEEFGKVAAEFARAFEGVALKPYKNAARARLYRAQLNVCDAPERFPAIRRNFQENDFLNSIAASVLKRPVAQKPDVLLDTYQNLFVEGIDNDIENILHADLHTPTVKMFFYLSRTNETNGAFVYAKGSHKLTLARLLHEYELSVREAGLKAGKAVSESLLERRAGQARNIIAPVHRRRMNVVETQICVEPNTLVVANNMGFHRRGEFTGSEPRKALLINYRKEERVFR